MQVVNALSAEPDDTFGQGTFHARVLDLAARLEGQFIGATLWEIEPGELVAFSADPAGAHTVHGPGRIVMFSAGDRGWGEAFVSVHPDSDKIAAAPGIIFRRADVIEPPSLSRARLLLRHADRIEDHWDGEPGAT